ncbi:hypothetical protein GCM10027451_20410 [Geodermatophilus aquaeductus]|uniref:hypothetical protein n=1 Tax=Geodermatophilus aquaeductus TaxID=1564161 RepID=UPI001158F9CD|nr:hypothetical protein [Geodermatophilus aquaeductus]
MEPVTGRAVVPDGGVSGLSSVVHPRVPPPPSPSRGSGVRAPPRKRHRDAVGVDGVPVGRCGGPAAVSYSAVSYSALSFSA